MDQQAPTPAVAPPPPTPEAAPSRPRANFRTVLRRRGFRNLWLGQVVSQMGDYFVFLALLVVVSGASRGAAETTAAVTGLMLALTLPRFFFGVLAGVFVDRWDRRRTMIAADLARAAVTLSLIPAVQADNLPAIYALAFLLSTFGTLFNPAKSALIPWLVPPEELLSANALSQTSLQVAQLLGPALAGGTFAAAGPGHEWVAFVVDAISFLISAAAVWTIDVPGALPAARPAAPGTRAEALREVWHELVVGLRALLLNPTVATVAVVFTVLSLGIGAINVVWVVFLRTQFGFVEADLAWRISVVDIAFGGGAAVAAVAVGNFATHVPPKWLVAGGLLGTGLLLAPLGVVPSYWLLVVVMGLIGLCVGPIDAAALTLVQVVVPNEQLGRVWGGVGTANDTASLVSMGAAGALTGLLGIPLVFLLGGILTLASGLLAAVRLPRIVVGGAEPAPLPSAAGAGDVPPAEAPTPAAVGAGRTDERSNS